MPQLDKISFISQIFWFVLVFGILYVVVLRWVLPIIAFALKIRKKKIEKFVSLNNNIDEDFNQIYITIIKNYMENVNKLSESINFSFVKTLHNYNILLVNSFFSYSMSKPRINKSFINLYLKKELLNLDLNE